MSSSSAFQISSMEDYYVYSVMLDCMKTVMGDSDEFELMYEAISEQLSSSLEDLTSDSSSSDSSTITTVSQNVSLDSLPITYTDDSSSVTMDSLNNLVSNVSSTTSSSSSSSSDSSLSEIYSLVDEYSEEYGVDSNLVLAIIQAESNFDTTATSSAGAKGLMQLMDSNSTYYGVTDPYDAEQNISAGVQLLSSLLSQYDGDVTMALMAYNAGSGTMSNRGVTSASDLYKMPTETQNYVSKVLSYYSDYSSSSTSV